MIGLRNLCTPAYVYFVVSIIGILVVFMQNYMYSSENVYCLGHYSCELSKTTTALIFVFKFLYVLFWTWILNLICGAGYKYVAWVLVLFPFILLFILLLLFILSR